MFPFQLRENRFRRNTCGVRIQESSRHSGEDHDQKRRDPQPCFYHDHRDIRLSRIDRRAHADDVHPAAHQPVDDHTGGSRLHRLFRLSCIITDHGQPGERHCHGEFYRRAEAHRLTAQISRRAGISKEDDPAQQDRKHKKRSHGDCIEFSQICHTHGDPQDDQCADHNAPHPCAGIEGTVRSQSAVIDHDRCPAHELEHIQDREQEPAFLAEAHLYSLHGALSHLPADQPREEHHQAADHMACDDRGKSLLESQRRQIRTGQDLRDGDSRAEPD